MQNASLNEAALDLSRLVDAAMGGEEVLISIHGKPAVRLVPVEPVKRVKPVRRFGALKGQVWIADDFDAPLPDHVLDAFEGK
ncbi:type II toxin-antitoxin system Phd/YefM family antitoxin [Burkholderia sp. MR1-5-21]